MSVTLEEDEIIHGLRPDGTPDPEYPRSLGIIPASLGLRSLAFTIDAGILLLLTLPLSLGTFPLWMRAFTSGGLLERPDRLLSNGDFVLGLIFYGVGQLLMNVFLLVQLILHGRKGVTVGKKIVGIRSVNVVRFTRPGFWRMVLRGIVFWASLTIIPILGAIPFLLSPLWDRDNRGRGWLDRIGGNWLVDVRRGLDPFDVKGMRNARRRLEKPERTAEEQLRSLATDVSGAVPAFVPAARSRSGVISPHSDDQGAEPWQPPQIATPPAAPASGAGTIGLPPNLAQPPAAPQPTAAPAQSAPAPAQSATPLTPAVVPARGAAAPAAPQAPARAAAVFEFDDGTSIRVSGRGLLGRAPQAPEGESFEHVLPVADEARQISKTHAEFAVDAAGCWFTDRGSVNGVTVTPRGEAERELTPWQRQLVPWGATVTLGGRSLTLRSDSNGGAA